MIVSIPVSIGELMDKVTILLIKSVFAKGDQLANVSKELTLLQLKVDELGIGGHPLFDSMFQALYNVNHKLWDVEDEIRKHTDNDDHFIKLARSVHHLNDQRSHIKRDINNHFGSNIVEEKIY
jgi:hypothetical protein